MHESLKRRSFLKGALYTSTAIAGHALTRPAKTARAACLAAKPEPEIRALVAPNLPDRATFDFYTDHKSLQIAASPDAGDREAVFDVAVRPIEKSDVPISLSAKQVSGPDGFKIHLDTECTNPVAAEKEIQCRIVGPANAVEKNTALFELSGQRGQEIQTLKLQVTVSTSAPHLSLGETDTRVKESPLKITWGGPVRYRLFLGNSGHLSDRFKLKASGPPGWKTAVTDEKGNPLSEVTVGPVRGMFQWEYPEEIWLTAIPGPNAKKKKTVTITVKAEASKTGFRDEFSVQAFYSDPLFSLNDKQGMDPRPHHVPSGGTTTYVLRLNNPGATPATVRLKMTCTPENWQAALPDTVVELPANSEKQLLLHLTAPVDAIEGQTAVVDISARDENNARLGDVRLEASVTSMPKIYFLVIDSMDYQYLTLNRNGDGPGQEGDWLCPNIRAFLKKGTSFSDARCGMPAATDMNHTTIASGANTGTLGAYWVSGYYAGLDPVGDIKVVRPAPDILRYGPDGKKLPRIFDLVKDRYPEARSVMISNKPWVSHLHEDGHAVKWGITGSHFPVYASPPPTYVLGDPQTDKNPEDRRPIKPKELIVNGNPLELLPQVLSGDYYLLKAVFQDIGEYIGGKPGAFPDDRWIADTACQVIREEDPEVLYVNLAATDEAGHLFGAAWDPDEWHKTSGWFSGEYWVSKYSEQARREEILDVVREADYRFGQIIAEIDAKNMRERSLIVFTADHSMITEGYHKQGYAPLDIKKYLRANGIISPRHYGTVWALNHWATVFDVRDDATREEIRKLLQNMSVDDPILGADFHPCIVLDKTGMRTGKDQDNPFIKSSEKQITEPDELYSEYYMEHALDGLRWPELCIFFRGHYQAATPGDAMIRGVNGMGERVPLRAKTSNRLVGIHGSRLTTHVPLIFSGPGICSGKQVSKPARLHDIVPTVCHAIGWQVPETAAGKILKNALV